LSSHAIGAHRIVKAKVEAGTGRLLNDDHCGRFCHKILYADCCNQIIARVCSGHAAFGAQFAALNGLK
jgi:hypothetical protein